VKLSPRDRTLIEEARRLIRARYVPDRHHVAAIVRTKSGHIYAGVHLDTYVKNCSICAESSAIARAATEGDLALDTIVSVRYRGRGEPKVVSPCGACRELLVDYGDPMVIYATNGTVHKARASRLLPAKYCRPEKPR
jgi:cytidine deaminase